MNLMNYRIVATGLETIILKDKDWQWPNINPVWLYGIEPDTKYHICMVDNGMCVVTKINPLDFDNIFYFGMIATDKFGYIFTCKEPENKIHLQF